MTWRRGISVAVRQISLASALVSLTGGVAVAQKTYEDYIRKYKWRQADVYIRIREIALELAPKEPHLGEIVTVTLSVTSPEDVSRMMVGFASPVGIELVSGKEKEVYWADFKENETKEFSTKVKFASSPAALQIRVLGRVRTSDGVRIPVEGGTGFRLVIVDEETGEFGTVTEWLNHPSRRVFMYYNHLEGKWMTEPDQAFETTNRQIVQDMKNFEPALGDSDALCLHADNHKLIINGIGDPEATDPERIKHLLDAGWLRVQRAGTKAKAKWMKEFMEKNRGKWGGESKLNFFRIHRNRSTDPAGLGASPLEKVTTTFIGRWIYQKHLYDKDQGLLWDRVESPVRNAEVGIRAFWHAHGSIWVGWGMTDDLGDFEIATDSIPDTATDVRAYPNLYTWGPERYDERIKVSKLS